MYQVQDNVVGCADCAFVLADWPVIGRLVVPAARVNDVPAVSSSMYLCLSTYNTPELLDHTDELE